jgi:hypothetical protein
MFRTKFLFADESTVISFTSFSFRMLLCYNVYLLTFLCRCFYVSFKSVLISAYNISVYYLIFKYVFIVNIVNESLIKSEENGQGF